MKKAFKNILYSKVGNSDKIGITSKRKNKF